MNINKSDGVCFFDGYSFRGFQEVKEDALEHPFIPTKLPRRSDSRSAGYDFHSKEKVILKPGEQHTFWTDVKAYMQSDEFLSIHVRSSCGIKLGLVLANTTGIVDSSYYENPKNDGNIGICLKNTSKDDILITEGDRIAQGIFATYLLTDDDNPTSNERIGGFGSSGK